MGIVLFPSNLVKCQSDMLAPQGDLQRNKFEFGLFLKKSKNYFIEYKSLYLSGYIL